MEQKNWINITKSPALYCRYAYFDLQDHLADSLFARQNVTVKYEQEFVNPINPYRLVICKVLPWHREGFLHALGELPNIGALAMRGALRWVITSTTPGTASAACVSIAAIRPRAIVE